MLQRGVGALGNTNTGSGRPATCTAASSGLPTSRSWARLSLLWSLTRE